MYRWHHAFGILACIVLLAHPLILAAAVLPTSAHRAWNLLSPARWFPANALGWVALFGLLGGLSASLMWRIRYATWRRLHFSLSLAVLLGIAHIFAYRGRAGDLKAPTELIYTYRSPDAAAYLVELQELADHQPLFELRTLTVQEDPRPVFALFDDVQDLNSREVYISGPPVFIHAVVDELHRRAVCRSHIHFEELEFRSYRS